MDDCAQRTDALSKALAAAQSMAVRAMSLQEVTAALSQARTESSVADVVLGRGLGIVEGARGILARVDGDRLEIIRASGYPPLDGAEIPKSLGDNSPLTEAVKSGKPLWLLSAKDLHAQFPRLFQHDHSLNPAEAIAAIPLRHQEQIVGALELSFTEPTAIGAADQSFTLLLAQAAADALFRAKSYDAELSARRDAESRAKERAEVLGVVAHDLRNLLNVISTGGGMLSEFETMTSDQHHKMIEVTQRAVRQMNRLIGDLLDASRLQTGHLPLELSDFDARQVVHTVEEMCRQSAESRGIVLRSILPSDPCRVRADEGRVLQALGNLVGNAVKFTDRGGSVTMSLAPRSDEVLFSVADTGHGIAPNERANLFDRFWQARNGDRRGVGLGLTIAKGIVEAHGGRIWVDSTPGIGSTFWFTLPIRTETPAREPESIAVGSK